MKHAKRTKHVSKPPPKTHDPTTPGRQRKPTMVRLSPELVDKIDKKRGLIPREPYVRHLLEKALK